jgi:hypothetical protein
MGCIAGAWSVVERPFGDHDVALGIDVGPGVEPHLA